MKAAGVKVHILPALSDFPDSIFVEDPALVFLQGAILLRPGARTRRGEVAHITDGLNAHFQTVLDLPAGGFVEGGDVLRTRNKIMIGLSERTNETGAKGLLTCLSKFGLMGEVVKTPKDVLHFKTDCSLFG